MRGVAKQFQCVRSASKRNLSSEEQTCLCFATSRSASLVAVATVLKHRWQIESTVPSVGLKRWVKARPMALSPGKMAVSLGRELRRWNWGFS